MKSRLLCLIVLMTASLRLLATDDWHAPQNGNPILPGYFADPSLLQDKGTWYLYATLDPWGGRTLGCWSSTNFKTWTFHTLNWPTKEACTWPGSGGAMVWAPSVIKAPDGRFHMFVSVGSEVWTGVADSPLGPWSNPLAGKPLIPASWNTEYHMIDAESFVDDDGSTYLYWGSGLNWVNGRCFAVKLKPSLDAFDGAPCDLTQPSYFEGPFVFKHQGLYYLSYSNGRTDRDTYQVHYATGPSPLGPFQETKPAPILFTQRKQNIISPGHHAVFLYENKPYILYHRQALPFNQGGEILRQICVDALEFAADGAIKRVMPTHEGPAFARGRTSIPNIPGLAFTASSSLDGDHDPACAFDNNYATLWIPAATDPAPWLQIDFGTILQLGEEDLRMEYAWKSYRLLLESSLDGKIWQKVSVQNNATGSPIILPAPARGRARFLRLNFPPAPSVHPAVFEWTPSIRATP